MARQLRSHLQAMIDSYFRESEMPKLIGRPVRHRSPFTGMFHRLLERCGLIVPYQESRREKVVTLGRPPLG